MLENEISFVKAKIEELTRIMNDLNDLKVRLEAMKGEQNEETMEIVLPEKITEQKKCAICGKPIKKDWNACPGTCRRKLAWKSRREEFLKVEIAPVQPIPEEKLKETEGTQDMEGTLTEEAKRFLEPREEIKKASAPKEKQPIILPVKKKKKESVELTEQEKRSLGVYEKCRACGKEFFVPGASQGAWAYRDAHGNKLCSWHCTRELEKRNEK